LIDVGMHDEGMNIEQWTAVEEYIGRNLVKEDKAIAEALAGSKSAGLPGIQVTPNLGKLLMLIAKMVGARKILEIGTLGGYSTIWLALGLAKGGKLITLELEQKHIEVARKNLSRAGVMELVEIVQGAALTTLPELSAAGRGPFDLIFIDADKENTAEYVEWSLKMSRVGTVIIVDNVVRDGKIIDPSGGDGQTKGMRKFYEMMAGDRRVDMTAIQTVSSKRYDGFAIGIVEAL
jgi:predicted O-methyltransferase YrrM